MVCQMVKVKRRKKKALYQEKSDKREAKAQTISYMTNAMGESKREKDKEKGIRIRRLGETFEYAASMG